MPAPPVRGIFKPLLHNQFSQEPFVIAKPISRHTEAYYGSIQGPHGVRSPGGKALDEVKPEGLPCNVESTDFTYHLRVVRLVRRSWIQDKESAGLKKSPCRSFAFLGVIDTMKNIV